MIRPIQPRSDYLEFKCEKCREIFHHTIRIYHDAPAINDSQRYDVRNWTIMGIELQCPKCGETDTYKLSIREDLKKHHN